MMRRTAFTRSRRVGVGLTIFLMVAVSAIALLSQMLTASAATFVVNSTVDRADANPGDGNCRTSQNVCTLQAAIQEANSVPGPDVIELAPGLYEIEIPVINDDLPETGDFDIHAPLTIVGAGADTTIIDGGFPLPGASPEQRGLDRLFEIHPTAGNVTMQNVTLREGFSAESGGAIQNWSPGLLRVENVHVLDNLASTVGGGINNDDPISYDWVTAPLNPPPSGRSRSFIRCCPATPRAVGPR